MRPGVDVSTPFRSPSLQLQSRELTPPSRSGVSGGTSDESRWIPNPWGRNRKNRCIQSSYHRDKNPNFCDAAKYRKDLSYLAEIAYSICEPLRIPGTIYPGRGVPSAEFAERLLTSVLSVKRLRGERSSSDRQ
jgi:hypothetical protein